MLSAGLYAGIAEFSGEAARRGHDLVAHRCNVLVTGTHCRCRGTDRPYDCSRLIADRRADANDPRQKFFAVDGVAVAADDAQ